MIVSESSWVPPLNYQSEGPFLISAYRSLLGIDGFYWFSFEHQPQWRQPSSANGYLDSLGKWVAATPELLGNFPAAALLYRQGYLQKGQPVVEEQRSLPDLWQRQIPRIREEAGFDPNRDQQQEKQSPLKRRDLNPLAFWVGPVQTQFVPEKSQYRVGELKEFLQPKQTQVQANTGEITWDYGRGLNWVDASKAQGVTGFLATAEPIELSDVRIESDNHYATVLVVSLDGQAISQSEELLIQVGTQARPTNWQERPTTWQDKQGKSYEGFEVVNFGQAPWRLVNNATTITVNNPQLNTATLLDMNGMPKKRLAITQGKQSLTVTLPPAGKYILLSRASTSE